MGWGRRWPEREPRPVAAGLSSEEMQSLLGRATDFVEASPVLREVVHRVQRARGRLYLWRAQDDLMARITPLSARSMLLETPRGSNSWVEHKRGPLKSVLKVVELDTDGSFHGLGWLAAAEPDASAPQVVLHRELGVPLGVLAEPRYWYSMHRSPVLAELGPSRDRALVRFVSHGLSHSFHGTCLYALRDGAWGCYTVKPSASASIASAEQWLDRRGWKDWA